MVVAVALFMAAACVPLPGVWQRATLQGLGPTGQLVGQTLHGWLPGVSLASLGLLGLLIIRFGLGMVLTPGTTPLVRRLWTTLAVSLYLTGTAIGTLAMALTMEERLPELVVQPGGVFRMAMVLTAMAGAALFWALSRLITSSGLGSGAMLLFAVWGLGRSLWYTSDLVLSTSSFGTVGMWMALHSGLVPLALMALVVWRWAPDCGRLPGGVTLRGSVDIVVIPLIVAEFVRIGLGDAYNYPMWTPDSPLLHPAVLWQSAAAWATVPLVTAWVRMRVHHRGHIAWLAAALALLGVVAVSAMVVAFR